MTDVEIFKELGEMGTLVGLFIEMARSDGKVDKSEFTQVIEAAKKFTDQDIMPFLEKHMALFKKLGPQRMYEYSLVGLSIFAKRLDQNTKIGVLSGLKSIAQADGELHSNEKMLFNMAVALLEVE